MKDGKTPLDIKILLSTVDLKPDDKLLWEKLTALLQLIPIVKGLQKEGLSEDRIIKPITLKKIEFIKAASTKAQLKEILSPPKVQYQGDGKIRAVGPYAIPEEEIIIWMNTSYRGPLLNEGYQRYMELFEQIYPEYADELK